jgi:hypothetical protein
MIYQTYVHVKENFCNVKTLYIQRRHLEHAAISLTDQWVPTLFQLFQSTPYPATGMNDHACFFNVLSNSYMMVYTTYLAIYQNRSGSPYGAPSGALTDLTPSTQQCMHVANHCSPIARSCCCWWAQGGFRNYFVPWLNSFNNNHGHSGFNCTSSRTQCAA